MAKKRSTSQPNFLLSKNELIIFLSDMCYYAQSHSADWDCRKNNDTDELESILGTTSFQVSCFMADQLSVGVDWDVVLEELIGEVKTKHQWKTIITDKYNLYSPMNRLNDI